MIYDDYNWPNGSCAGKLLLEHPEYNITQYDQQWYGPVEPGGEIKIPLDGEYVKTFCWNEETNAYVVVSLQKAGDDSGGRRQTIWKNDTSHACHLLRIQRCSKKNDWVGNRGSLWLKEKRGLGYTDLTNSEASKTFIQMTHQRYYRELKEYFGSTIKGFFDDESMLMGVHDNPRLSAEFAQRYGYDLLERLDDIFISISDDRHQLRADYGRLNGEFFGEHMRRIDEWCREHGVDSTGHYLGEENPVNEIISQGAAWPVRKQMSVPGLDLLGCDSNYEPVPARTSVARKHSYTQPSGLILTVKLAAATARYLGTNRVMVEAFGAMPYWVAPVDLTANLQWLTALGANFINDNLLTLSFKGFRKFPQGGRHFTTLWWNDYGEFAELTGRCSLMTAAGQVKTTIGLFYPALTAQCLREGGNYDCDPNHLSEDRRRRLQTNNTIQQTAEVLLRIHQNWEIIFEELIAEAEIVDGVMKLPNAEFSVIIVPAAHAIQFDVLKKLESFAESGGHLVFLGVLPSILIDSQKDIESWVEKIADLETVFLVPATATATWFDLRDPLKDVLGAIAPATVTVKEFGAEKLLVVHRVTNGGRDIFHVVNMCSQAGEFELRIQSGRELEIWNPSDGKRYRPRIVSRSDTTQTLKLEFAPWEGEFLVASDNAQVQMSIDYPRILKAYDSRTPAVVRGGELSGRLRVFPGKQWNIRLEKPNMVHLKCWARLDPGNCGSIKKWFSDPQVEDWEPVIDGQMPFEQDPTVSETLWIKGFFAVNHCPDNLAVVVDSDDYTEIYLNGEKLYNRESYCLWDAENVRLPISKNVIQGLNYICVRWPISDYFHPEVVLKSLFAPTSIDPIILMGNFTADVNGQAPPTTYSPRHYLYPGSWARQGYNAYTGAITYSQTINLNATGQDVWIDLGEVHVVAELTVNGKFVGKRCWPPYLFKIDHVLGEGENLFEIKVRNSLGQLIRNPGWKSYLGETISEAPSGLLGPVVICEMRNMSDG